MCIFLSSRIKTSQLIRVSFFGSEVQAASSSVAIAPSCLNRGECSGDTDCS